MVFLQLVLSPIFLPSHGMPLRTHLPFSPPADTRPGGFHRWTGGCGGNCRTGGTEAHGRGARIAVAQRKMGWGGGVVWASDGPLVWTFVFQCCSFFWVKVIKPYQTHAAKYMMDPFDSCHGVRSSRLGPNSFDFLYV